MNSRRAFSVAIFAQCEQKILLIEHARLRRWLPVGGEIEPGETPIEAAKRELREETGLEGSFSLLSPVEGTPPGLLGYEEHEAGSKGLHMNFAFLARVPSQQITRNREFTNFRWFGLHDDLGSVDCPQNVRDFADMALADGLSPAACVALRWLDAFNTKNLERLLDLYHDDAVHTSPKLRERQPETRGVVRGKAALRAWFEDAMTRLPKLNYHCTKLTADGSQVFMEYQRRNPGDADLSVAERLTITRSKISESYVYHG